MRRWRMRNGNGSRCSKGEIPGADQRLQAPPLFGAQHRRLLNPVELARIRVLNRFTSVRKTPSAHVRRILFPAVVNNSTTREDA